MYRATYLYEVEVFFYLL